ncbi:MAG: TorF family putative porin [Pseudomonadota bacterium]|nr:TorF family putative porin [Pseudomonadota bacterium]
MPFTSLRTLLAITAAAAFVSGTASAQAPTPGTAPGTTPPAATIPAPDPEFTFTGNVGLYSQYVFRGVSQTNEKPALQGGFDLAHKSGLYVGTWASNISWLSDAAPNVSASLEWDMYGGYKGALAGDFGYDVGLLYYYYPGSYPSRNYTRPDTLEGYAGLTWKFLSLKYSYVLGNKTFGFADSRGSDYVDLTANYDIIERVSDTIGKVTLTGHVGHQRFKHSGDFNYTDWKLGASTEFYGVTAGLFATGTNAKDELYTNPFGRKIAGTQVVAFVQKTF